MLNRRHQHDDRHMTLRGHFQELAIRLSLAMIILLGASALAYVYRSSVIPIILEPAKAAFGQQKLMYLNPAGGFNFIFLISIYIGVAAVTPFVIQQLYIFIRPTLPKVAQRLAAKLLLGSGALLVAGMLFGYYIAIPGALKFLDEFAGDYITASLTADSYLNFLIAYTIGLGLLFQIPIILIIGNHIRPFTPSGLLKSERWAILLIFIAAAIITPTPDPINMCIVALPILFIYQIGVVSVLITNLRKKRRATITTKSGQLRPVVVPLQPEVEAPATGQPTATVLTAGNPKPAHRTIDGIVSSYRQPAHRTRLAVAPRPTASVRVPASRCSRTGHSPRRALDGISMMTA